MALQTNIIIPFAGNHADIPAGFTRETSLDGLFIKATPTATNPNVTGGAATHTHTSPGHTHFPASHTHTYTLSTSGSHTGQTAGMPPNTDSLSGTHYHTGTSGIPAGGETNSVTVTYGAASNNPPFYEVIFIKASSHQLVPQKGLVLYAEGAAPLGFKNCDASAKSLYSETMAATPATGILGGNALWDVGGYVTLTTAANNQNGYFGYNTPALGDFVTEFDLWAGPSTSGADGVNFYFGTTTHNGNEETVDGGYRIYFSEFHDLIAIRFNGSIIASVAQASLDNSTWRTAKITKVGLDFEIFLDGVSKLTFTDIARTLAGTKVGWGARTGGLNNEHRIKNVLLYESGNTPDLTNKYLRGAGTAADAGTTGGSVTNVHDITHGHTETNHTHVPTASGGVINDPPDGRRYAQYPGGAVVHENHTHAIGLTGATIGISDFASTITCDETVEPAYKKLLLMQKIIGAGVADKMIALWLGNLSAIPAGWVLCDGSNGTPDMRDKFLKVAVNNTEIGNTGGSNTHTHAAKPHTHTSPSSGNHTHPSITGGEHVNAAQVSGTGVNVLVASDYTHTATAISSDNASYAAGNTTGNSSNNEPEYRTVAFIMYDNTARINDVIVVTDAITRFVQRTVRDTLQVVETFTKGRLFIKNLYDTFVVRGNMMKYVNGFIGGIWTKRPKW